TRQHLRALALRLVVRHLLRVERIVDVEDAEARREAAAAEDLRIIRVVDVAVVARKGEEARWIRGARRDGLRDGRAAIRRVVNAKLDLRDDRRVLRIADVDDTRKPAAGLPLRARRGAPATLVLEDDVRLAGDGDGQRVL